VARDDDKIDAADDGVWVPIVLDGEIAERRDEAIGAPAPRADPRLAAHRERLDELARSVAELRDSVSATNSEIAALAAQSERLDQRLTRLTNRLTQRLDEQAVAAGRSDERLATIAEQQHGLRQMGEQRDSEARQAIADLAARLALREQTHDDDLEQLGRRIERFDRPLTSLEARIEELSKEIAEIRASVGGDRSTPEQA